jgi:murein L,D-transpeptidase YcbB/YkuD
LYKKHAVYLSVCLLVTPLVSVAAELATPVMSPLQSTLAQLPQACSQLPSSLDASAQALLVEFYAQQQFAPAWSQATRLEALLPQLEQLADDGLNPASYQLASLRSFAQQSASAAVDDWRARHYRSTKPCAAPMRIYANSRCAAGSHWPVGHCCVRR